MELSAETPGAVYIEEVLPHAYWIAACWSVRTSSQSAWHLFIQPPRISARRGGAGRSKAGGLLANSSTCCIYSKDGPHVGCFRPGGARGGGRLRGSGCESISPIRPPGSQSPGKCPEKIAGSSRNGEACTQLMYKPTCIYFSTRPSTHDQTVCISLRFFKTWRLSKDKQRQHKIAC